MEKNIQKKLTLLVFALLFALAAMGAVSAAENSSDNLTATSADKAISTQDTPQTTVTSTDSNTVNQSTATAPKQIQIPDPYNTRTEISYTTIQAAINDPLTLNGDTIWVQPGTYTENVIVNKRLTIIPWPGMPGTVTIDATGTSGSCFRITAAGSGSTIQGFILIGAINPSTAGVYLDTGASNCNILQNTMRNNWAGMFIWSSNNQIYENIIIDNNRHGIRLVSGSGNNNIYSNIINNNNLNNAGGAYGGITTTAAASGNDNIYLNQIVGNHINQIYGQATYPLNAINNWWGTNSAPTGITGATYNPWLVLGITAVPGIINVGQT